MSQKPLPPGEPIRPHDAEVRRFEPAAAAPETGDTAENPGHGAEAISAVAQGHAVSGPDVDWIGFANEPIFEEPPAAEARTGASDASAGTGHRPPSIGEPEKAAASNDEGAVPAAAANWVAANRVPPRRRLGAGVGRLLRLGAAAASLGVVAIFVYHDGARLTGLPWTTPNPETAAPAMPNAAPDPQVAHAGAEVAPGAPTLPAISEAAESGKAVAPVVVPDTAQVAVAPAPATPDGGQTAALDAPGGLRTPRPPPSDPPEPVARYLNRAKAGDPVAQYNLAVTYAQGQEIAQDYASAAAWFREAAANGNPAAQFNLGVVYERGLGVEPDMAEAIAWYRRAAERNYAAAEYNLAVTYAAGSGTSPNPAAAARWYRQAAGHGLAPAMVNLAILYETGEGVEFSLSDAYAWYRAAARRGDPDAGKRAGELFQQFTGADKAKAVVAAAAVVEALREPAAEPPAKAPAKSSSGRSRTRD